MTSGNDKKTREQLLAEIEALKDELEQRTADGGKPAGTGPVAPVFSAPLTRRESLVKWVAPVILALPVVQAAGMILKPGTARGQVTTVAPTSGKKASPTAKPSLAPTQSGRCVITPTAAPS